MKTDLINVKDAPQDWRTNRDYLYIGRPSYLGNPYKIGRDGDREEVIAKYRLYLAALRREDPDLFEDYLRCAVQGSILACHCKPLACHGDVILEALRERGME